MASQPLARNTTGQPFDKKVSPSLLSKKVAPSADSRDGATFLERFPRQAWQRCPNPEKVSTSPPRTAPAATTPPTGQPFSRAHRGNLFVTAVDGATFPWHPGDAATFFKKRKKVSPSRLVKRFPRLHRLDGGTFSQRFPRRTQPPWKGFPVGATATARKRFPRRCDQTEGKRFPRRRRILATATGQPFKKVSPSDATSNGETFLTAATGKPFLSLSPLAAATGQPFQRARPRAGPTGKPFAHRERRTDRDGETFPVPSPLRRAGGQKRFPRRRQGAKRFRRRAQADDGETFLRKGFPVMRGKKVSPSSKVSPSPLWQRRGNLFRRRRRGNLFA